MDTGLSSGRDGDGTSLMELHDHEYHSLVVADVVDETADTRSFVLEIPSELAATFAYAAGQFCTFRATIDGEPVVRCYSMSSSPDTPDPFTTTVKRVPGGRMSNWMNDRLTAGDHVEVLRPTGLFVLHERAAPIVAFAGGSGITPVFSLLKTALATTSRRARLLYANRDPASVIFAAGLDELVGRPGGRLQVAHHYDVDRGFVDGDEVRAFLGGAVDADFYLCGPQPFMDVVEAALLGEGVGPGRVHIERFTPPEPVAPVADAGAGAPPDGAVVTVQVGGRTGVATHRPGTTLLQAARQLGLSPPSSCEAGNCATCMARLVEGAAMMHVNNALTDDEVAAGWVLTCQAVPTSPSVRVVYGYEEA
jgi:3-ketosteroid 9alpha-monooxygenase subunit B